MENMIVCNKLKVVWDYILETEQGFVWVGSVRNGTHLEIEWGESVALIHWYAKQYRISSYSYDNLMHHPDPMVVALLKAAMEV